MLRENYQPEIDKVCRQRLARILITASIPHTSHHEIYSFTSDAGFTLIELLVVISIIAILAGIALPVFGQVQVKAAQTKALSNAKQIGFACRVFADDNNGQFPTGKLDQNEKPTSNDVSDANEAFGQLIPTYMQTEQMFFVPKSAFTPFPPDEKFKNSADVLKAGENHFAYVFHLGTTSTATFPLIADGFARKAATPTRRKRRRKAESGKARKPLSSAWMTAPRSKR